MYWQRYCTAVEQWARAKLCGVEHRAPPRPIYSARRPSRRAVAHVVDTVCLFKARLGKFWMHQVVKYDFTADLTVVGDRSVHDISVLYFLMQF